MIPRSILLLVPLLLAAPGCEGDDDDDSGGPPGDDDDVTGPPASYSCTEPEPLGPPVNTEFSEMGPSLSGDGLVLYFSSDRPGGEGSADLWMATRATVDSPWEEPVNVGATVNNEVGQNNPAISADGTLLLYGDRTAGDYDLWEARRDAPGDPWADPARIDLLATTAKENKPALSWDGQQLYFKRSDESLISDLWVSERTADGWAEAVAVDELNDDRAQTDPAPTPQGDTLFFVQGADTNAPYDVYYATWDGQQWHWITRVDEVSAAGSRDEGVVVGPDGREFLMVSDRADPDNRDLYRFTCERTELR